MSTRKTRAAAFAAFLALMAAGRLCTGATWQDGFDYPDWSAGEPAWQAESVTWACMDGRMTFQGGSRNFLVLRRLGTGRRASIEATVELTGRRGDGWAVAGLAIRRDPGNYWHLALIESPKTQGNRRSVELAESYAGRWLANYQGETALVRTADVGAGFQWEHGVPYRLRLAVSPQGIEGTVSSSDGKVLRRIAYRFDPGKPAVKSGRLALTCALAMGKFDDVKAEVDEMTPVPNEQEKAKRFPPYNLPGCKAVRGRRTGFFHPEKHGDTWWLIDPNGWGFFAVGTDHVTYRGHWCEKLGYAPYGRIAEKKYGSEENWAKATAERLHRWGFNTLAAGHSKLLRHTYFAHVEWFGAGRSFADIDDIAPRTTWTGFPNVFSPRWPRHCELLARKICEPNRDDPWLIGYFLDNELQWFGALGNWQNEFGLFTEAWKKPADHTAKQALVAMAKEKFADIEAFNRAWGTRFASYDDLAASQQPVQPDSDGARALARAYVRRVAELYFKTTTEAIRRHDPNHLVLGCRFAGWSPGIWDIAGRHCDVVTFNSYPRIDVERGVPSELVEQYRGFYQQAQKPLWITEWSFPALDSGLPCKHGAGMRVATQAQKARCYTAFQSSVFSLPFFVGSDYFMYLDEPALGISETFPEDSNYGLVNEQDEPWPELTAAAAAVNPRACELHRGGRPEHVYDAASAAFRLRPVPPPRKGAPPGAVSFTSGPLEIEWHSPAGYLSMRYDGKPLGRYEPLIHQRTPTDLWSRPDTATLDAVREDGEFIVLDMTFGRKRGGQAITQFDAKAGARVPQRDEPPAYRAGWRIWVPRQSRGWFAAQSLWVENADERPWQLAGIFHYTDPTIGGSAEGDSEEGFNVPNFYVPLGAWRDPGVGLGQAVTALGDGLRINYWKDKDGFHSDCYQRVDVELDAGRRYEAVGPVAVHFGYRVTAEGGLLEQLARVRQEAWAALGAASGAAGTR